MWPHFERNHFFTLILIQYLWMDKSIFGGNIKDDVDGDVNDKMMT